MKRKIIIASFIVLVILVASIIEMSIIINKKNKTINRYQSNQNTLLSSISRYKTSDSLNVVRARNLYFSLSDVNDQNSALKQELKSLDIKCKQLQNIIVTSSHSDYQFIPHKVDTIIKTDTIRNFYYTDKWVTFKMINDSVTIQTRDSILLLQHCKTKKFLWWTWKKYTGETTIKNYNPHTTIDNITSIDINK